jgi:hypothetical protein
LAQFADWLWKVMHGDLGVSLFTGLQVSQMIGQRLAPTFTLMIMTLILSVTLAVPLGALAAWRAAGRNGVSVRLPEVEFAATPSAPFDIAIMEKTARAAVAPCDIGWADLGAWDEVWRLAEKDADDNVARGPVALKDARGCLVIGDGVKVAVSGVEDLIIVATADGVVVLPKARAQDVKALLAMLEKRA